MKIEYNIPNYTKAEAYSIIDNFLNDLVNEHKDKVSNPSKMWNTSRDKMNFKFTTYGSDIKGDIKLLEGKLIFDGNLPLIAWPFKGMITGLIEGNLEKAFPKK
jgi:hypothetical protein